MHSQAGSSENELAKRRDNTREMIRAATTRSSGNAVLLIGDTNTRYTRCGDVIAEALDAGFGDAWVDVSAEATCLFNLRAARIPQLTTADLDGEKSF